jgi:replicative DNA helicase
MVESNVARIRPADEKSFRLAPHNIEAEQALLGAILVNNEAFYRVSDFLNPEHFYEPVHREIYEIAGKIIRAGKAATPITVKTYLPDQLTGEMTMQGYLARLVTEATTVINAGDYGQTIYDLAIRRSLIQIGEGMTSLAYEADVEMTAPKQIEEAEKSLFDLAEKGRYDGGFQPFNEALTEAIKMAGEAYQRDGRLSGIATGLTDLDQRMGGLQKSDLIIIAGRPGMAKTSLATTIGFHVARNWKGEITPDGHRKTIDGGQVAFFSLEMSAEQLATRILSAQAEISSVTRASSRGSSMYPTCSRRCRSISTTPAACRSASSPPAPAASSGRRGSTSSSSTTSSCFRVRPSAPTKTACR